MINSWHHSCPWDRALPKCQQLAQLLDQNVFSLFKDFIREEVAFSCPSVCIWGGHQREIFRLHPANCLRRWVHHIKWLSFGSYVEMALSFSLSLCLLLWPFRLSLCHAASAALYWPQFSSSRFLLMYFAAAEISFPWLSSATCEKT